MLQYWIFQSMNDICSYIYSYKYFLSVRFCSFLYIGLTYHLFDLLMVICFFLILEIIFEYFCSNFSSLLVCRNTIYFSYFDLGFNDLINSFINSNSLCIDYLEFSRYIIISVTNASFIFPFAIHVTFYIFDLPYYIARSSITMLNIAWNTNSTCCEFFFKQATIAVVKTFIVACLEIMYFFLHLLLRLPFHVSFSGALIWCNWMRTYFFIFFFLDIVELLESVLSFCCFRNISASISSNVDPPVLFLLLS